MVLFTTVFSPLKSFTKVALNDLQSVQTLALETLVGLESKNDEMRKTLNLVGRKEPRKPPTDLSIPTLYIICNHILF